MAKAKQFFFNNYFHLWWGGDLSKWQNWKSTGSFNLSLGFSPSPLNSTHSSFSTSYRTLGSLQSPSSWVWPASSTASVYAGAGGLVLPDLGVPLHQCAGQLGIWGPSCRDGQESGGHRGHPEWEGDYAMPEWPPGFLPGEGEKPGGW